MSKVQCAYSFLGMEQKSYYLVSLHFVLEDST